MDRPNEILQLLATPDGYRCWFYCNDGENKFAMKPIALALVKVYGKTENEYTTEMRYMISSRDGTFFDASEKNSFIGITTGKEYLSTKCPLDKKDRKKLGLE